MYNFRVVLTQAVVKSPVGGDYISSQCRNYLEDKNIDIIPPYMVASKEITKPDEPANWKRKTKLPKVSDTWHTFMVKVYDVFNIILTNLSVF